MCYKPKFIKGMTIEELQAEYNSFYSDIYKHGYIVDRLRLWDILHTIDVLNKQ